MKIQANANDVDEYYLQDVEPDVWYIDKDGSRLVCKSVVYPKPGEPVNTFVVLYLTSTIEMKLAPAGVFAYHNAGTKFLKYNGEIVLSN